MAKDLNQCNFIGRLGKDPEIRHMPNGDPVASFSIACSDDYKDRNGDKVEQTNWVNIVAYRGLAKVCGDYLAKGSKVFISGKLQTRKWQDQQGQDKYTTEIVANELQMLDGKRDDHSGGHGDSGSAPQQAPRQAPASSGGGGGFDDFDDDIPF